VGRDVAQTLGVWSNLKCEGSHLGTRKTRAKRLKCHFGLSCSSDAGQPIIHPREAQLPLLDRCMAAR
jgi:hypothetical protein